MQTSFYKRLRKKKLYIIIIPVAVINILMQSNILFDMVVSKLLTVFLDMAPKFVNLDISLLAKLSSSLSDAFSFSKFSISFNCSWIKASCACQLLSTVLKTKKKEGSQNLL